MYINHDNAKKMFLTLIANETPNWIIISGGENSGKTCFIKEVCPKQQTLFCETNLSIFYLDGFISYISLDVQVYLKKYLSHAITRWEKIKNIFNLNYINDIEEINCTEIIRTLIRLDISEQTYTYANYLGSTFRKHYIYIVLDNFHKCDKESYEWLLNLANNYLDKQRYMIAVCDFEKEWESNKIYEIFHGIQALVDIRHFDTMEDYFNVLKEKIYFDNIEKLRCISEELFLIYKGDAQLLFKTIKIYESSKDRNDYDRQNRLMKIAHNLTFHSIRYSTKMHQLVLEFLAISPIFLSKNELSKILEVHENVIQDILIEQYNDNLIEFGIKKESEEICYHISDSLICNMILRNISPQTHNFILNRFWMLTKSKILDIPLKSQVDFSLELADSVSESLLWNFLHNDMDMVSEERYIEYIDRLYLKNLHKTNIFSTFENANIAYKFGYYNTALKMLEYIRCHEILDYSFYMLLGDVQHLLLLPEASKSFKQAADLSNISISQKLSAINRQIMSLNQSDRDGTLLARRLYDSTLENYSNNKCNGLIELYRNTNNNYPMDIALEYTIKGFFLAIELENELEKYKCMHNICMIKLHQNLYSDVLKFPNMNIELSFELVDIYFKNNPKYYHERAYPLLDLGTYEMFKYISNHEREHLKKAKKYYSSAQLFAKSFYAKHIAETALLITNTHLYCNEKQMLENLCERRKEIFKKYSSEDIIDYRVNRKILLSLSVSAVLTQDIEEAKKYIILTKPYIWGKEILRYNNLCNICGIPPIERYETNDINDIYYSSTEFVPWLISFGH